MAQPPKPQVIDDPRVLARLLAEHLPVELDAIPSDLPNSAVDLLLRDQDLDLPSPAPLTRTVPGSNSPGSTPPTA